MIALTLIASLGCAVAAQLTAPRSAYAQEGEEAETAPFRVGFYDVSKSEKLSAKPKERLTDLLTRADGVTLDEGAFATAAKEVGLDLEELRTGDGRDANRQKIGEAVRAAGLDMVVLIDVYKKGKTLQVLALGADGEKIHESKSSLKRRSDVTESQAKEILKDVFEAAIPVIMAQREADAERLEQERLAREQEERELQAQQAAAADQESAVDVVEDEARDNLGPLRGGITLGLGGFAGLRGFVLALPAEEISSSNGLVGAGGKLRALKALSGGKMHVGLDADLAWAPFSSIDQQTKTTLPGDFVRGGGVLKFAYALANSFALGVHAGADAFSFTLEPNRQYTGHRYIWARTGLDILIVPTPDFFLEIHGSALPLLSVSTSQGAYGEADGGLGFEAGATTGLHFTDTFGLMLDYRYTAVNVDYTNSPLLPDADAIASSDGMHSGLVALSLSF